LTRDPHWVDRDKFRLKVKHDEPLSNFAFTTKLRPYSQASGGAKTLTLQLDYHHAGEPAHTRTAAEEEARPFHLVWSPARPDVRANVLEAGPLFTT